MPHRFFKENFCRVRGALIGYLCGATSASIFYRTKEKKYNPSSTFFEPKKLKTDYDYLAPDASEIRLLQTKRNAKNGDLAHCKLPIHNTSIAVKHKTVEEIWYFSSGIGEMWLKENNGVEHVFKVEKGMALTIPIGASFQFRNTSEIESLEVLITTMPPWPGQDDAIKVQGKWTPSVNNEKSEYELKKST